MIYKMKLITDKENIFYFDINDNIKKTQFKDYICPSNLSSEKDYFKYDNRYGRVVYLREYANYIKDDMVAELTNID